MSFGFSDEVMERMVAGLFWSPGDSSISGGYINTSVTGAHNTQPGKMATSIPAPPERAPMSKPVYTDAEKFFSSSYLAYRNTEQPEFRKGLYSQPVIASLNNIADYYECFFKESQLNKTRFIEAASDEYSGNAGEYLFDGIVKNLFPAIESGVLPKADFRDTVDDLFQLMQLWGIAIDKSNGSKRSGVYKYLQSKYGLKESPFFCCPYCGTPLIKGIAYCPSCFENSKDEEKIANRFAPERYKKVKQEEQQKEVPSRLDEAEEQIAEEVAQAADDKAELEAHVKELEATIKKLTDSGYQLRNSYDSQISDLLDTINQLRVIIKEKDDELRGYSDSIKSEQGSAQSRVRSKILIFGACELNEALVFKIARETGLNPDTLDIRGDYKKLKNEAMRIKKDASYTGIILGPVPHKVKGSNATSPIEYFKGPGFPFTVEAKTYSGTLKITEQSLRDAFSKMYNHMLAMGQI